MSEEVVLALAGVSKSFGATRALSDVSIELRAGEVHALIGENGAGKSTLIKIMTGIHAPDAGGMQLLGEPFAPSNAAEAQVAGVAAIYQEPSIFPDLTVAENIFIGHQNRGWRVDTDAMEREAAMLLGDLDVRVDPTLPALGLSVAAQQAVEIAKAMALDTRVLIMDEPTAALSAHEVDRLFAQVRRLKDAGVAVLFISHRLEELFEIADTITVLRDGEHISTRPRAEVTEGLLVREMVGREVGDFFSRSAHPGGDVVLRVGGLGRTGVFSEVSFEVRAGEVLGIAGLVGAGRTDVALAIFGVEPAEEGTIELDGRAVHVDGPADAVGKGISYLSEDRRGLGLAMTQSVAANITLGTLDRYGGRFGLVDRTREREDARELSSTLGIKTPGLDTEVAKLSGGNQQKTMLAKWLNADPRVLILDEPTRGIDVGAKADVHELIDELARSGIAIVMISSDLPEVLAMSDRIAVMREGRLVGVFDGADATQESVMQLAVGAS